MTEAVDHPDILVIQCDSLPPDLVGAYGSVAGATPNIDRLAERGTRFEAYCNAPLCTPSRASMMTGRLASTLGVFDNASEFSSDWPTMAHAVRAVGYETAIIGKMHFLGYDQYHGFQERLALETDYSKGYNADLYDLAFDWDSPVAGNPNSPQMMGESYVGGRSADDYLHRYRRELQHERDEIIHSAALDFLSRDHMKPFLAFASYHSPHNPFWAPEELVARFWDAPVHPGAQVVGPLGVMDEWLNAFHYVDVVQTRMMTADNLRWMQATLYAMLFQFDQRVGELIAALPHPETTVVIFTSDHGDMLGDRGMLQKRTLYERSARVPLIVAGPGVPANVDSSSLVSLVDLFPTVAAIAGAPIPSGLTGSDLMAPIDPDRTVLSEYHGEGVHAPCFMLRVGGHKLIYVHGHESHLFDLETDPLERHDLRYSEPEIHQKLLDQLLEIVVPDDVERRARVSQRHRRFIYDTTGTKARFEPATP